MNRWVSLSVTAAVVVILRADARACDPAVEAPHAVDTSMQATDQTPPTLPAIPTPEFHHADDSSGCGGSKCGEFSHVAIQAVATDDMTLAGRIGYRFTLESGSAQGVNIPTTAIEPVAGVIRLGVDQNTVGFDFVLQVVAIDLAGNMSAPQSLRVEHFSDSECSLAPGGARPGLGWLAMIALIVAVRQRRR
jgi:MYXO-CTERM domain-containing protein